MADFLTPGVVGGGLSLLGAGAGLLGSGSRSQPTSQFTNQNSSYNNTQTNSPWAGIQQYFMGQPGGGGTPGIWPSAAANYSQSGWTPAMQDASQGLYNDTFNNNAIFKGTGGQNVPGQLFQGQFDTHIAPASSITAPAPLNPQATSPVDARAAQGQLDPTNALSHFLTGDQTNPWIGQQQKAITDQMTRNFNEN